MGKIWSRLNILTSQESQNISLRLMRCLLDFGDLSRNETPEKTVKKIDHTDRIRVHFKLIGGTFWTGGCFLFECAVFRMAVLDVSVSSPD
jgi:hypothetical protein